MSSPGIPRPVMSALTMFSFEKSMAADASMSSLVTVPSWMAPAAPPATESITDSAPRPRLPRASSDVVAPVPPFAIGIVPVTPAALPVMSPTTCVDGISPTICVDGISPVICDDGMSPTTCDEGISPTTCDADMSPTILEPLTVSMKSSPMGSPCQAPEMTLPEESTAKVPVVLPG